MFGPPSRIIRVEVEGFRQFDQRTSLDIKLINIFLTEERPHQATLFAIMQLFQDLFSKCMVKKVPSELLFKHQLVSDPGQTFVVALVLDGYAMKGFVRHEFTYTVLSDLSWELQAHFVSSSLTGVPEASERILSFLHPKSPVASGVVGDRLLEIVAGLLVQTHRWPFLGNQARILGVEARVHEAAMKRFYVQFIREMLLFVMDESQPFRCIWDPSRSADSLNRYADWYEVLNAMNPDDSDWELAEGWADRFELGAAAQPFDFDAHTDFSPGEMNIVRVLLAFVDWGRLNNRPAEVWSEIDIAFDAGDSGVVRTLIRDVWLVMSATQEAIKRYGCYSNELLPFAVRKVGPSSQRVHMSIGPDDFEPITEVIDLADGSIASDLILSLRNRINSEQLKFDAQHRINFTYTSAVLDRELHFRLDLESHSGEVSFVDGDSKVPLASLSFEDQKLVLLELLFQDDFLVFLSNPEAGLSASSAERIGRTMVNAVAYVDEFAMAQSGLAVYSNAGPPIFIESTSHAFVRGIQKQLSEFYEDIDPIDEEDTPFMQLIDIKKTSTELGDGLGLEALEMTPHLETSALVNFEKELGDERLEIGRIWEVFRAHYQPLND